jgi:hypothetical protein
MNNTSEVLEDLIHKENRIKDAGCEHANYAFALFVLTDTLSVVEEKLRKALAAQSDISRIVAFRQRHVAEIKSALSNLNGDEQLMDICLAIEAKAVMDAMS